ncbi:MAG: hypothetical protein H7Y31_00195 [Chitinophagaceae bacterium]|nr:hypothetical protein [Chitinophagaceae bacterium]
MRRYSLFLIAILFFVACDKDKVDTRPSIDLQALDANFVPTGGGLFVTMDFTDKEGDLSSVFVQKLRLNQKVLPTLRDTFSLIIPEFDKRSKGSIRIPMEYQNHLISAENPGFPPNAENDTLQIRFAVRDAAGNVSDTAITGVVVIGRN